MKELAVFEKYIDSFAITPEVVRESSFRKNPPDFYCIVVRHKLNEDFGYDWALEANGKMRQFILDGDHPSLINFSRQGKEFQLAVPTPEHYLPLLYALAPKEDNESISLFNDKPGGGLLSMTSVKIGVS